MFYTRIPIPKSIGYSDEMLNKSTRYFPLIGWLVGGVGAFIVWLASNYLPLSVAVIIALAIMVLLTGAFHEDAFADFCDGFGGGYTKEKILTIMKDSRIGVYAAVGLVFLVLLKYTLLIQIPLVKLPIIIFVAHAFSRLLPVLLIFNSKYVSISNVSKSKPVADKNSKKTLLIAVLFGILPVVLINIKYAIVILFFQIILFFYFKYYVHKKIGGYTGDVLGALQQISEVLFYFVFLCSTAVL